MKNCIDRESYSLTAGLALGLVILGSGSAVNTDLPASIPDTLHYYMVGGHIRPFSGAQKDKYKSPRYVGHVSYNSKRGQANTRLKNERTFFFTVIKYEKVTR